MEMDRLNAIKASAQALLSYKVSVPEKEGEKAILSFFLDSYTEEIGKKNAKVVVPATISKISINKVMEKVLVKTDNEEAVTVEEKLQAIAQIRGDYAVSYMDKANNGFGSWLSARPEFTTPEERQFCAKFILGSMVSTISELEKTASVADPYLDCKRRFCSSDTYDKLSASLNPKVIVLRSIQAEIDALENLKGKAEEVDNDDYLLALEGYKDKNGLQEDKESSKFGFVKLRGVTEKKEEKKEEVTTQV